MGLPSLGTLKAKTQLSVELGGVLSQHREADSSASDSLQCESHRWPRHAETFPHAVTMLLVFWFFTDPL